MGNTYFQFQQFRVDQDLCALKVCTDSCFQGAATALWLRERLSVEKAGAGSRVLDIGGGTGLLSLMLAQALPETHIDAVELDPDAAKQASGNFSRSPWADRMTLIEGDIRDFVPPGEYDAVICNPPFYENDLKSGDSQKDIAKHALSLTYTSLLDVLRRLITRDGIFSVMLPYRQFQGWQDKARADGFYPVYTLNLRQSPVHGIFRTIGIFTQQQELPEHHEVCIREAGGKYSALARRFLGEYYLYFPGD